MASPLAQASAEATAPPAEAPAAQQAPAAPQQQAPDPIAVYTQQMQKNRKTLDDQIERLKKSLDERTQYPFDPFYMRMAAEFGKPTKTGSFYEGLGNAASGALDFYEKEHNKNIEINKQKLELLKAQQEAARGDMKLQLMADFGRSRGMLPGGAPSAGRSPELAGAPSTPSGMPSGTPTPSAGTVAPVSGHRITDKEIFQYGMLDKELGTFLMNLSKNQKEAIISTDDGLFDTSTNTWVVKNTQVPKEYSLPFIGNKMITADERKEIDAITSKGRTENWSQDKLKEKLAEYYASKGWLTKTEGGKPVIRTPEEQELEREVNKGRITSKLADEKAYLEKLRGDARAAPNLTQIADQNIALATNPDTRRIFGVLQEPTVGKAFLNLVRNGVALPSGKIEIPGIEEFVTQTMPGATPTEMNARKMAIQNAAQLAFEFRNMLKGSGAISDYETRLAAALGPDVSDTPTTIILKSEILKQRGRFNESALKAYNTWAKSHPDKFIDDWTSSSEYKTLLKHHDAYMKGLYDQFFPNKTTSKNKPGPLEKQIR